MANYTITVPFARLPAKFRRFAGLTEKVAYAASRKAAPQIKKIVLQSTRDAPPTDPGGLNTGGAIDTRAYLQAWAADALDLGTMTGVLVYNAKHYAGYVEHGRRPHSKRPPIPVIMQWAQRKLKLPYKEAKRAAFAIANAIGRRGLRPRLVLTGPDTERQFRKTMSLSAKAALSAAVAKWGT